jgi:plasmid stabilization system protein ParE
MDEAAEFYAAQEPSLGPEVYEFLKSQALRLTEIGGLHRSRRGVYKWVMQGRFPHYTLFYRLKDDEVTVSAIIDGRRDPAYNRSLLKSRP